MSWASELSEFLVWTMSFLSLLTVSTFTYLFSKRFNLPYTVLLVIVWLFLVPLSKLEFFSFINTFQLTPDLLFFVFLPTLLFESAYNIKYRELLQNWKSIFSLAVVWLLIAMFIIGGLMYYTLPFVGLEVPFLVCLLFWALISATDPVAVLALFKSMWAPKRLALIFEWESLFNDWTAYAMFMLILWIIIAVWDLWSFDAVNGGVMFSWFISFLSMVIWWILFWSLCWVVFSKIIWKIKNSESAEITLTMILAHVTFLLAELLSHALHFWDFSFPISGIIATTIAAIIIWNYWRYKISPKVEHHMEKFWGFFAFLSNSLVFILLGLTVSHINFNIAEFWKPILMIISFVVIARAISVYIPVKIVNKLKVEEEIPKEWQHLLSWGSLRWALALALVLMVPDNLSKFEAVVGWEYAYSIKDFLVVITVSCIFFTMFVKATTIGSMMRRMKVNQLNAIEEFEYDESKILVSLKLIDKLGKLHKKGYLIKEEYELLKVKYEIKLKEAVSHLKSILAKWDQNESYLLLHKAISLHSLGIEKQALMNLFKYNEIDESTLKYMLHKIDNQIDRLESGRSQLKNIQEKNNYDFFEKCARFRKKETILDRYIRNRTKVIISNKVVRELEKLKEIDFGFGTEVFDDIIALYKKFNDMATEKLQNIAAKNQTLVARLDVKLVDKSLLKLEEKIVHELYEKNILTSKLYIKMNDEIEEEIYKDIRERAVS